MAKILVVDDDTHLCGTLRRVLELAQHDVLLAHDGWSGFELFLREDPDLVITDIMMPEIDGTALIRLVKSARPGCSVIALSGSESAWAAAQTFGPTGAGAGSTPPLARARRDGADLTLGKPFELEEFLAEVEGLLSARAGSASRPSATTEALYHIRPDGHGRWVIHRDASDRPIMRAGTKEDAVQAARRIATSAPAARIIVHKGDGTIDQVVSIGRT